MATEAEAARETKRERFERLFPPRVDKVLKSLDVLGNCANRTAYEYTDEDVDAMVLSLLRGVEVCKSKFLTRKTQRPDFELPGVERHYPPEGDPF